MAEARCTGERLSGDGAQTPSPVLLARRQQRVGVERIIDRGFSDDRTNAAVVRHGSLRISSNECESVNADDLAGGTVTPPPGDQPRHRVD